MDFICEEIDCWFNINGCCSTSDLWDPDLGEDCPDYDPVEEKEV